MYAIGKSDYDFIKIERIATLADERKIWSEIRIVEYDASLYNATIFRDLDRAEQTIEELRNHADRIKFRNNNALDEILNRERSFDKLAYIEELKIYKLIPIKVDRKDV